jgi:hypothetical protein
MRRSGKSWLHQAARCPAEGFLHGPVSCLIGKGRQTLLAFGGLLSLAIAGSSAASAEPVPLDVSGSVRIRQEFIQGQIRADASLNDSLTSVRSRIAAKLGEDPLSVEAEIVDSRAYFYDAGTPVGTGEVNTLELVQASLSSRFRLADTVPVSLKAGRFTLNLGSRRLVASDDYRNTTNGYTGLRIDLGDGAGPQLTAVYVMPQQRLPGDREGIDAATVQVDRASSDAVLWGGVGSVPAGPAGGRIEATAIAFREQDGPGGQTRDRHLDTLGLRYFREPEPGRADFDAELYLQSGKVSASLMPDADRLDVEAGFLHLEGGYQWSGGWRPRLAAEFDLATGERPGGAWQRFDTLFGMRRAEIAPAGLYGAVGRANLVSPGLRLEAAPDARSDVFVAWRGLWLASETDAFSTSGQRDAQGRSGRFAGHQIDTRYRRWITPGKLRLELNTVVVLHGEFLKRQIPGSDGDTTVYGGLDLVWSF